MENFNVNDNKALGPGALGTELVEVIKGDISTFYQSFPRAHRMTLLFAIEAILVRILLKAEGSNIHSDEVRHYAEEMHKAILEAIGSCTTEK